ncbi:hypothetical protein GEMRC1_008880 [Eukaryota sp. GEM-RC1]
MTPPPSLTYAIDFGPNPGGHVRSCVIPFALFLHNFFTNPTNSAIIQSLGDELNLLSIMENCLTSLLEGLKNLGKKQRKAKLEVISLLQDPDKYRNFCLLVLYNLLVLNLDIDISKVNNMVVSSSMFITISDNISSPGKKTLQKLKSIDLVLTPLLDQVSDVFPINEVVGSQKSQKKAKTKVQEDPPAEVPSSKNTPPSSPKPKPKKPKPKAKKTVTKPKKEKKEERIRVFK